MKSIDNKQDNLSAWYLLQCKPRDEFRANSHLINQGYTTFLPEIKQSKKTKATYKEVSTPLFPGYLFIKLNKQNDNWASVRSTRGVNKLVSFGMIPAKVPTTVIDVIKNQIERVNNKETYPYKKGDKVTIETGPFKDLQAVFEVRNDQQRVWVLIELMGKWQRISINDLELNKVA